MTIHPSEQRKAASKKVKTVENDGDTKENAVKAKTTAGKKDLDDETPAKPSDLDAELSTGLATRLGSGWWIQSGLMWSVRPTGLSRKMMAMSITATGL